MLCKRCGFEMKSDYVSKRKSQNMALECMSCTQKPVKRVVYPSGDYCQPHFGDFDAEDYPLKNGMPFRPGARTCGSRDCVRTVHIIPQLDEVEALIIRVQKQANTIAWDAPIWQELASSKSN